MKVHLKLWLLVVALFAITYCEAADETTDEATSPARYGEQDGGEEEEEEEDEEVDPNFGEDDDDEDPSKDYDEPEEEEETPMEPLTSEQMKKIHQKIDANGNGKVSMAELTDYAHKMRRAVAKMELDDIMASKDTDKDGKLTFDEFLGDAGKVPEEEQNERQAEFKGLDTNSDKFLDHDELASVYHHHTNEKVEGVLSKIAMKDKDKNRDGVLSLEEFYTHLQPEDEDPVEISAEDKDIFNKLDMDGSKSLSLKELQAWESGSFQAEEAAKKIFEHTDKDKDNHITAEEFDAAKHDIANDMDADAHMYMTVWVDHHTEKGEL